MSDTLRDRIAAALRNADEGCAPWDGPVSYNVLADAVIAELGLEEESFAGGYCTRHVTQWELNDNPNNYCLRCGIPHTTPCKRGTQ